MFWNCRKDIIMPQLNHIIYRWATVFRTTMFHTCPYWHLDILASYGTHSHLVAPNSFSMENNASYNIYPQQTNLPSTPHIRCIRHIITSYCTNWPFMAQIRHPMHKIAFHGAYPPITAQSLLCHKLAFHGTFSSSTTNLSLPRYTSAFYGIIFLFHDTYPAPKADILYDTNSPPRHALAFHDKSVFHDTHSPSKT